MRWKEGKKNDLGNAGTEGAADEGTGEGDGRPSLGLLLVRHRHRSRRYNTLLMMRTAGEEREKRETKRETQREREKIRGKMNQVQTRIFYIQFFFFGLQLC
jgi:hypothetical protein